MSMMLRRQMMSGERLGPNLLKPLSEWYLTENRGTITIDELGRMVFEVTSTSGYNLYAIMQGRTLTYADMAGKRYRIICVVDSISISAGNVGIATAPDFTANSNPTRSSYRTGYFPSTPITAPGEYASDIICDADGMTTTASFSETNKLGQCVFLNASTGSTAIVSKLELHEIL